MTKPKPQPLYFECPTDRENAATFLIDGKTLSIAVSEERAMDSYNQTFECTFLLSQAQAVLLRDYLNQHIPAKSK